MDKSIPVTVTGNATASFDFKRHNFLQSLNVIWAPDIKFLGADYALVIAPNWGSSFIEVKAKADTDCTISVGSIAKTFGAGGSDKFKEENTGFGDLYIQPLWLAWRGSHYDIGFNYGFYAPTGYYRKDGMANIGFGFSMRKKNARCDIPGHKEQFCRRGPSTPPTQIPSDEARQKRRCRPA